MNPVGIRLLLVDDEEVILQTLEAFLKDEGFTVFLANSGEAALDFLQKEAVDLVVVDMRLPNMDGNMLILEALRIYPKLKFIIYTGSSGYNIPPELTDSGLGGIPILRKPLKDMDTLVKLIDSSLKPSQEKP